MNSKITYEDATVRIGGARNLGIAAWWDAPTVEQMRRIEELTTGLKNAHPAGIGFINVIVQGTPRFSPEVRDEIARQSALNERDLGTAHVILIGGITGATVRTFLSTVFLVARPKNPTKVFADVATAAAWLAPLISPSVSWTAEEMIAAIDEVVANRARAAS